MGGGGEVSDEDFRATGAGAGGGEAHDFGCWRRCPGKFMQETLTKRRGIEVYWLMGAIDRLRAFNCKEGKTGGNGNTESPIIEYCGGAD